MRLGVIAALSALSSPVAAEPLEWSGFLGVDKLPADIGFVGEGTPEQRPLTAPIVGGRITYLPLTSPWLAAGVEGELSLTTSWTGYGFDARRSSYFAPIIGYRADAIVRFLPHSWLEPHVVGGGGGATVATSSPFLANQTDGVYFWGVGVTLPVQQHWLLRADARQVWLPAMTSGTTNAYELHVAIGGTLGHREPAPVHVEEPPPPPPEPTPPPTPPPPPPPADTDGDGIADPQDQCPEQAEDKDGFQDDDGCPDPDNDGDGIPDASDKCPDQPETKNGIDDGDGCPDQVPPAITAAFDAATAVRFEPGKVRMTTAGKASLAKLLGVLRDHPMLRITVTGHDKDAELGKKRAEAVKWYLVDKGVAQDQVETVAGPEAAQPIEITIR